jgi:hypothetical protein
MSREVRELEKKRKRELKMQKGKAKAPGKIAMKRLRDLSLRRFLYVDGSANTVGR